MKYWCPHVNLKTDIKAGNVSKFVNYEKHIEEILLDFHLRLVKYAITGDSRNTADMKPKTDFHRGCSFS